MINWVGDQVSNWRNVLTNWLADCTSKSVSDRMIEEWNAWMKEYVTEWVSDWLAE